MEYEPELQNDKPTVVHQGRQTPGFPNAKVFIDGLKELVEVMPVEPLPCRDDPELFHPIRRSTLKKRNQLEDLAKQICSKCVIRDECLAHGIKYDESGIWGGKNADERDALRHGYKEPKKIPPPPPAQPDHLEPTG